MKKFKARVRVNGNQIEVRIEARNQSEAKALLEAQYGKGSITFGPVEA